jgi:hypothetical protein
MGHQGSGGHAEEFLCGPICQHQSLTNAPSLTWTQCLVFLISNRVAVMGLC